jgi:hypothetical protein
VYNGLLIVLLVVLVALLLWRQNQARGRAASEREERRARTDQILARALRGDDRQARHTVGGAWSQAAPTPVPPAPPAEPEPTLGRPTLVQAVDIDILLGDEPETIAEQARRALARPTTLVAGTTTQGNTRSGGEAAPALSILDGRIDVSLDALAIAWFAARGYVARQAPQSALPISLLLRHRHDKERSYAFMFERGRLSAQRAGAMVAKAQELGMNRLLVAAEHGAEPMVGSSRMPDVLVMDWVALDRELKKIDFRIAAKIIAMARTRGTAAA